MEIIFGNEHFNLTKNVCGVYKVIINDTWFYIGSSVDIRRRLSTWKHHLSGRGKKPYRRNRSIMYIMPIIERVKFEIVELVTDKSSPKIREDFYIKENFDNEFCLNLTPGSISTKGRKLPLGVVRREKKYKPPPTPKKPVAVFDLRGNCIMKCESIGEATRKTGVKEESIRGIFSGKPVRPRKYVFKPINKDGSIGEIKYATKQTPEVVNFIIDNFLKMGTSELSRRTGVRQDYINNIVRGRVANIKGILPRGTVAAPKRVIKMDLVGNELEIHPSISAAAKSIGSKTGPIQDILHGRGRYQCKGYKFKFADDNLTNQ